MTSLIHPCQKRALTPLKFEVIFNYDTFFQGGTKLAQLTVCQNDKNVLLDMLVVF